MRTLIMLKALGLAVTAGIAGGMVLCALSATAACGARCARRRAREGTPSEDADVSGEAAH